MWSLCNSREKRFTTIFLQTFNMSTGANNVELRRIEKVKHLLVVTLITCRSRMRHREIEREKDIPVQQWGCESHVTKTWQAHAVTDFHGGDEGDCE